MMIVYTCSTNMDFSDGALCTVDTGCCINSDYDDGHHDDDNDEQDDDIEIILIPRKTARRLASTMA